MRDALALALLTLVATLSAAAPLSALPERSYSAMEQAVIEASLERLDTRLDQAAEGKSIERVVIRVLPVFTEDDPVPGFVNVVHVNTRDYVIRRELLFQPGDAYAQARIDETARNLRNLGRESLVLVLPLQGSAPDRVRVLVVVRDIWSLQLSNNIDGQFGSGSAVSLAVALTEKNLLGTHQVVSVGFSLNPFRYGIFGTYYSPRVGGSRLQAYTRAGGYFNLDTGRHEGTVATLLYGKPLYSLATRWGWDVLVDLQEFIDRRTIGGLQGFWDAAEEEVVRSCGVGLDPSRCVPIRLDVSQMAGRYRLVRSWGLVDKVDLEGGLEALRTDIAIRDAASFDPDAVASLQAARVRVSDTRVGPYTQLTLRTGRFRRVINYDTLGFQEDVNIGYRVEVKAYSGVGPASTRQLFGAHVGARYRQPIADGFAEAGGSVRREWESAARRDGLATAHVFLASPSFGVGRLFANAALFHRFDNYLNRTLAVGGDLRPRGYPAGQFQGKDAYVGGLEVRSAPFGFRWLPVGLVAFYDVGHATDGVSQLQWRQSLGGGVRLVFPMFQRSAFRVDLGVPLEPDAPSPVNLTLGWTQVLGPTSIGAPDVILNDEARELAR